jgi:hypothetical protein
MHFQHLKPGMCWWITDRMVGVDYHSLAALSKCPSAGDGYPFHRRWSPVTRPKSPFSLTRPAADAVDKAHLMAMRFWLCIAGRIFESGRQRADVVSTSIGCSCEYGARIVLGKSRAGR